MAPLASSRIPYYTLVQQQAQPVCEDVMGVALRSVKLADRHVVLSWADGRAGDRFSLLWLKDHCPSPHCLHPETRQRQIDTFSIPENIAAREVAIEESGRV